MSQDDVRVSPELIAKLNALATYLTAQGEYDACDLIDTVVERVSAMPGRELLAEALSALEAMVEWFDPPIARGLYEGERDAIADARAAADKIRASLTQENQT